MDRTKFLSLLESSLGNIPYEVKQDILYDYREHFSIGLENGKNEEEISKDLGDPKQIARTFKAECALKTAESSGTTVNIVRAVLAALGLGFFNLIFVVGPFFGLLGILAGLFAAAFGIAVSGIAAVIAVVVAPFFPDYLNIQFSPGVLAFAGIGTACLGGLGLIGMFYLSRLCLKVTVSYLKFNLRIITGRRNENV